MGAAGLESSKSIFAVPHCSIRCIAHSVVDGMPDRLPIKRCSIERVHNYLPIYVSFKAHRCTEVPGNGFGGKAEEGFTWSPYLLPKLVITGHLQLWIDRGAHQHVLCLPGLLHGAQVLRACWMQYMQLVVSLFGHTQRDWQC